MDPGAHAGGFLTVSASLGIQSGPRADNGQTLPWNHPEKNILVRNKDAHFNDSCQVLEDLAETRLQRTVGQATGKLRVPFPKVNWEGGTSQDTSEQGRLECFHLIFSALTGQEFISSFFQVPGPCTCNESIDLLFVPKGLWRPQCQDWRQRILIACHRAPWVTDRPQHIPRRRLWPCSSSLGV